MADNFSYNIITVCGTSDVEVKRSHFLGCLRQVRSEEEARAFISEVRKEHYDARHHCFAMRIGTPSDVYERSGDDGEPSGTAGRPMLEILKGMQLYDVCAVVTRYFGGTLLGTGGLVRAYSDSLKEALGASEITPVSRGSWVEISCDYQAAGRIKRYAFSHGLTAYDETYGADCRLGYLLPEDMLGEVRKQASELSLGRAVFAEKEKIIYYRRKAPVIYSIIREKA